MAKKKRASRGADIEVDDATSLASSSTLLSVRDVLSTSGSGEDEYVDPFERCLDSLYEKRSSTRVGALNALVSLLERNYCYEDCLARQDGFVSQMLGCIRKGATQEATAAARALGLHLLTLGLGPHLEGLYNESIVALQKLALFQGKDVTLRCLALDLVALLTFLAQEDPDKIDKTLSGMLTVADSSEHPKLAATALRGWSLLVSSLPSYRLNRAFCTLAFNTLSSHLHAKDVGQRDAAGEGAALLSSTAEIQNDYGDDSASGDDSADEINEGLSDIVDRMKMLATNRGDDNRRSKKDRSFLKSVFREHYKVLEGQRVSFDKIKLTHGRLLIVDSLGGQIQLNAFRAFLGPAFQPQLESNSVLWDIFGLDPLDAREIPQESSYRVQRGPSTATMKMRSKNRSKDQLNKAHLIGSIMVSE